jgi:hypothetical protein
VVKEGKEGKERKGKEEGERVWIARRCDFGV